MVFTFSYNNELTNHSASQMNDIWGRDRTTNHSISGYSKGVILLSRDVKIFSFMVRIPVYHHVFWALKRTVSMRRFF